MYVTSSLAASGAIHLVSPIQSSDHRSIPRARADQYRGYAHPIRGQGWSGFVCKERSVLSHSLKISLPIHPFTLRGPWSGSRCLCCGILLRSHSRSTAKVTMCPGLRMISRGGHRTQSDQKLRINDRGTRASVSCICFRELGISLFIFWQFFIPCHIF